MNYVNEIRECEFHLQPEYGVRNSRIEKYKFRNPILQNYGHVKVLEQLLELKEDDFIPIIRIDVPMPIGYISEHFVEELELLEPFGKGNVKPIFAERHFKILGGAIIGKNKNVFKGKVQNMNGDRIEAIYFGDVEQFQTFLIDEYGKNECEKMFRGEENSIDIAFTYYPAVNEFNNRKTLQIVIQNYCRIKKEML